MRAFLFAQKDLVQCDGKDGNECLVALDVDVYLIEGFALWKMGEENTPSGRLVTAWTSSTL